METKKIIVEVEFPARYSYESVAKELSVKLQSFYQYYDFSIGWRPEYYPAYVGDNVNLNEGEKFVDW